MTTKTKLWTGTIGGLLLLVLLLGGIKAGQIGAMIAVGKSFAPPPEAVTSASAEADAALARLALERAERLFQGEASAQADLDAARARAQQAEAAVAGLKATIAKKTIRAPFDGRIAIRQVEVGQVVSPGTPIASLQSIDPILAEFWLPQQALADLKEGQQVQVRTDTFPDQRWEGRITTVNPEVDVSTRNVRVRATLANPGGRLRPGMFANVEVLSAERRPVLLIPATSVLFAPYGDSVYVLEQARPAGEAGQAGAAAGAGAPPPGAAAAAPPGLVARQRFVRLGERRGDLVAVASGLAAGEVVVSSGAFKLRNGMAVVVKNDLAPDAQLAPSPADR